MSRATTQDSIRFDNDNNDNIKFVIRVNVKIIEE